MDAFPPKHLIVRERNHNVRNPRAQKYNLKDAGTLAELCKTCSGLPSEFYESAADIFLLPCTNWIMCWQDC
jgi:hypothetical protein